MQSPPIDPAKTASLSPQSRGSDAHHEVRIIVSSTDFCSSAEGNDFTVCLGAHLASGLCYSNWPPEGNTKVRAITFESTSILISSSLYP